MTDLLKTVRERYTHSLGFSNLFTVSYRSSDKRARQRERFAHDALERGILQTVSRDLLRYAGQWEKQSARSEALWMDRFRRSQKKTELFIAEAERRWKESKHQAVQMTARQAEQAEERERKSLLELRRQSRKDIRNELRRLREDEEYKQRRRGV